MGKTLAFEIVRTNQKTGKTYLHTRNGVKRWNLANAKRIAKELHDAKHAARVRIYKKPIEKILPDRVRLWKKWTPTRGKVRQDALTWGMSLTSGDRDYNSLASVGRVSDHWTWASGSWADDYWHSDMELMNKFAAYISAKYHLKQVLVHDAGSGDHVHVAGET